MEEWKEYKIGEIVKTNISQYSLSENWETIKYLDTGSITKNHISNIEEYFGNSNLPSRARRKVKSGDIIYSCVRPNQCHFGFLNNPPANLLVSTGFVVISADTVLTDSRYLYYYLTQDKIIQTLHNIGEQAVSTYPSIKASDIEDLTICLPPLAEQKAIASILSSLDDKIELNRRINANLEAQAQALFKSWFVDFEPFRDGEFVESELGMIPKGWRVGKLSEIADITMGTSPSGTSYNTEGIGDVFYQGRAEFSFRFPQRNMFTTEAKRFANIDSVLVSVRAPVGDINVAEEKCCIGRGLASVQSKKDYNSYILYLLKSLRPVFERFNGEGTVFGSINKKAFEELKIIVPPESTISKYESIASIIDRQIKDKVNESRRLATLRDTLLPRLMSGELKVNELNN